MFERDGEWFASTEHMEASTLQTLLKLCASSTSSVELLVERDMSDERDDDSRRDSLSAYVQSHAGDIFSKGMHWSMDEAIKGII